MIRAVAVIIGVSIVSGTLLSAARTVVVPRAENPAITRVLFGVTRVIFRSLALRVASPTRREQILSRYAPVNLLTLPFVWATLITVGAGFVYWGLGLDPASDSFIFSGSSITTLGTATSDNFYYLMLAAAQAVLGLEIIALMISFLPSIYGHFSSREVLVTRLEALCGLPFDPETAIIRADAIGLLPNMSGLWKDWSDWFASIEESHSTFAFLAFFRSPEPDRSWVAAAATVLDTASLRLAVVSGPEDPWARLMIRTGYLSIRRVADLFGVTYDPDPAPDDPISIPRTEFDAMYDNFVAAGVPVVADRDQAWRDFAGWRVNYDAAAAGLAEAILAPPGRWLGQPTSTTARSVA